ncbi:MAG: hypothetical protein HON90_06175, partial [Halobacteriovoraceae bacterium]|nr:hypothetical protein [Halobacteriovoraceae bacterium]
ESYVHRIGRTGRGGSKGIALSIIEPSEVRRISQIERLTKAKIELVKLPTVQEIVNVLTEKSVAHFDEAIAGFAGDEKSFASFKERFSALSQEDLMKGLYTYIFEQSLKRYKRARSIDLEPRGRSDRNDRSAGGREDRRSGGGRTANGAQVGYERYHITIGRQKGMVPGELIRLVSGNLAISGGEVGKISIMDDFSFFEIPDTYQDKALGLSDQPWNGENFKIQVAKGRSGGGGSRSGGRDGGGYRSGRDSGGRRSYGNSSGNGGNSRDAGASNRESGGSGNSERRFSRGPRSSGGSSFRGRQRTSQD